MTRRPLLPPQTHEQQVFCVGEVAKIFGVSVWTIRDWIRKGDMKAGWFKHRWRITREEIESITMRQRLHKPPNDPTGPLNRQRGNENG